MFDVYEKKIGKKFDIIKIFEYKDYKKNFFGVKCIGKKVKG